MCRPDLHVLSIRALDLVLNPALQRSVAAGARAQTKDNDGSKGNQQSEEMSSHSVCFRTRHSALEPAGQKLRGLSNETARDGSASIASAPRIHCRQVGNEIYFE
jgi:hypothetical protein